MRPFILILFIWLSTFLHTISQDTFVKTFDTSDSLPNQGNLIIKSENRIHVLQACRCNNVKDCTRYSILDKNGNIIFEKTLAWLDSDLDSYVLKNDTISFIGSEYGSGNKFMYLYRQKLNGDSIDLHVIEDRNNTLTRFNSNGIAEFNNQLIMVGTASYVIPKDSILNVGVMVYINKDFTIDTIVQITNEWDNIPFRVDIGLDSLLYVYVDFKCNFNCETRIKTRSILKFNKDKVLVSQYNTEKYTPSCPGIGAILEDSTIILGFYDGWDATQESIRAININGEILWENASRIWSVKKHYTRIKQLQNDDLLVIGYVNDGAIGSFNFLRTSLIQRIDKNGNTIWERKFGRYIGTHPTAAESFIVDFVENEDKSFYLTGAMASFSRDMLLMKVDSFGCIDQDKCNDHFVINPLGGLHKYDQVDMKQKKWYYTVRNKEGKSEVIDMTFGKDTIMYDNQYGNRLYKHISYSNKSQNKIDTIKTRWDVSGKLFYMPVHNTRIWEYIERDSLLYDFTLRLNDKFLLPRGFGLSTVIAVDSIDLLDGYKRKRITLRHDNLTNRSKLGDLIWIEGIGATNGLFYFYDWIYGTKTSINCYFDRNKKRWGSNSDCDKIELKAAELKYVTHKNLWTSYTEIPLEPIQPFSEKYTFSIDSFKAINNYYYFKYMKNPNEFGGNFEETGRFFRQEKNKVFELIDVSPGEYLVFDFGLNVGDSTNVLTGPSLSDLVVLDTDTIIFLDGKIRKRITLKCLENDDLYIWIEGFGELSSFNYCSKDDDLLKYTTCYWYDEVFAYDNNDGKGCWIVDTKEILELDINIYPNPGFNKINIVLNQKMQLPIKYKIINTRGLKIAEGSHFSLEDLSINVSQIQSGFYILSIIDQRGKIWNGKWIKN